MLKTLEIVKKNPEAACWRVNTVGVAPVTKIDNSRGYTLLVKVDGETKISAARELTVYGLYHPGKNAPFFGGKNAYESIELLAFDQSEDFFSEWALAGPTALSCYDPDYDVDCKAIARGTYHYKVVDFYTFFHSFELNSDGEVVRTELREKLRSVAVDAARSVLMAAINSKTMRECNLELETYSKRIADQLNKVLVSRGLEVERVALEHFDYDFAHLQIRTEIDRDKLRNARIRLRNEGRMDDLRVREQETAIDVMLIDANGRAGRASAPPPAAPTANTQEAVFCPNCGTKCEGGNFCKKCGAKL